MCVYAGWMDDLQVKVLFNGISVISGSWNGNNEKLCAVISCIRLKRFSLPAGIKP